METGAIWDGLDGDPHNGHEIGRRCTEAELEMVRARAAQMYRSVNVVGVSVKEAFVCSCGKTFLAVSEVKLFKPLHQLVIKADLS